MKKVIKISDKEYTIKSSAYTQFKYKNDTGRNLLSDLQSLRLKIDGKKDEDVVEALDDMLDIVLKITYILIDEANQENLGSYEDFLKGINDLFGDISWIADVIECAIAPLSGGIKGTSPQK
jgi:hypothetical protein